MLDRLDTLQRILDGWAKLQAVGVGHDEFDKVAPFITQAMDGIQSQSTTLLIDDELFDEICRSAFDLIKTWEARLGERLYPAERLN